MAIHQIKKQTDLEKRLKLLRTQLYGKSSEQLGKTQKIRVPEHQITSESEKLVYQHTDTLTSAQQRQAPLISTDITYLHQDLLKISILAGLALGVQIILFYLLQNNLLRMSKLLLVQ